MIENYQIRTIKNSSGFNITSKLKGLTLFCALMLFAPLFEAAAQVTYTLGTGATSSNTVGVTPYSTSNVNSRSQYIYLAEELLNEGAGSGNIISFDMKITQLAAPASLKPENIQVKMGPTQEVVFGNTLVPNLPVYFTASVLPINEVGWFRITLDQPYEWDGEKNIIIEICRSNSFNGTSFEVEATLFNQTDFRSVGLFNNNSAIPGCTLTGETAMIQSAQRTRPNIRFTMTNPCSDAPSAPGTTVVSANASCGGTPFTLSVANGATESGLSYQWQSSPTNAGPWTTIAGAVSTTYTTPQAVSTWYRRGTLCIDSGEGLYSTPLQVGGDGCFCTVGSLNENAIGITNVSFNTTNNSSANNNFYTNYTALSTTVNRNETYNLSVNVNTLGGTNYTAAWIDWNNNNIFEASEQVLLGNVTGGTNVNSGLVASVTIPTTALIGETVMRVRTKQSAENTMPQPCGAEANGETEDYAINIQPALSNADFVLNAASILATSTSQGVKVMSNATAIASVAIFDISGRLVAQKADVNQHEVLVPLAVKGQVVIVKVTTTQGLVMNKKVILN